VPGAVKAKAELLGLPAPSQHLWAGLTPLQRFTLLKLTRDGHDNENFVPALREFGLLDPQDRPGLSSDISRSAASDAAKSLVP
jgi:hypothetical protein